VTKVQSSKTLKTIRKKFRKPPRKIRKKT